MPVVNPLARELVFKIVYYGPGLGGKTTSLQHVHATARPEHRGRLVSLATPVDRTLYFDFLPVRLPALRGMSVRLQLFTVPGQVYYNATRKLVLTGADGVVMVVDSQRERLDANLESLENLVDNLREHGRALDQVPHVLQYNKRDLPGVLDTSELERRLNRLGAPAIESVAVRGDGVYEALDAITRAVLGDFERRVPAPSDQAPELVLPEGGIAEVLRAETDPPSSGVPSSEGSAPTQARPDSPAADESEVQPTPPPPAVRERRFRPSTWPSMPVPPVGSARPAAEVDVEVVEPAPRVVAGAPSFALLFSPAERPLVGDVEQALARRDANAAILATDRLVSRVLAGLGSIVGGEAPRDPALAVMLLGVSGPRYLELRARVRDARAGAVVGDRDALAAYVFALELAQARSRVT